MSHLFHPHQLLLAAVLQHHSQLARVEPIQLHLGHSGSARPLVLVSLVGVERLGHQERVRGPAGDRPEGAIHPVPLNHPLQMLPPLLGHGKPPLGVVRGDEEMVEAVTVAAAARHAGPDEARVGRRLAAHVLLEEAIQDGAGDLLVAGRIQGHVGLLEGADQLVKEGQPERPKLVPGEGLGLGDHLEGQLEG